MKVAVIFLVVLGLLAALCAAVLVNTLAFRAPPTAAKGSPVDEVEIYVAAHDLPAMTLVDQGAVRPTKVGRREIPAAALTSSTQVVGRVLTTTLVEGAAFTETAFARKSDGAYLAASLPRGKRAVSVSLTDWSGMAGLLYPGGVVDVLVSFKSQGSNAEMVSTTLLQGLPVLAIGSQSVTTEGYADKEAGALSSRGQINFRMITLLVDPRQAEILQLAVQNGSVSLAMRNPLDAGREAQRMTRAGEIGMPSGQPPAAPDWLTLLAKAVPKERPAPPATAPVAPKPEPPRLWETLIVRGTAIEKRTFPLAEAIQPIDVPLAPTSPTAPTKGPRT
jgi:pilus assembly protein CpaB